MKKFCKYCQDKTKHEKDECLEGESLSNSESESESERDGEDEYRKLDCKNCKLITKMKYLPGNHNFICQSCNIYLLGSFSYKIFELGTNWGLELYVTKDMFIYLVQYDFFNSLMEIYENRIFISTDNGVILPFINDLKIPILKSGLPFPQMMKSKNI